jgi:hypothetical protein
VTISKRERGSKERSCNEEVRKRFGSQSPLSMWGCRHDDWEGPGRGTGPLNRGVKSATRASTAVSRPRAVLFSPMARTTSQVLRS